MSTTATANTCSTEPCRSTGLCRMLFGAAIIGSAAGWFMIGLALTKYDLDLGRIADAIAAATNAVPDAAVREPLAAGTASLRASKAAMENDVFGAILGAFCLSILGSYMLRSGVKRAMGTTDQAGGQFWSPGTVGECGAGKPQAGGDQGQTAPLPPDVTTIV